MRVNDIRQRVSAAEGPRFAQVVRDFTEQVRQLGANPFRM